MGRSGIRERKEVAAVEQIPYDLADQLDFSYEGFALDQTTVIYYEDPQTGENVVLQKL